MRTLVFGVIVLAACCGRAEARWVKVPPGYDPASGRVIAPASSFITGRPAPPPKFMPIVGSARRTSHFRNPFTGTARYRGAALDPVTGRTYGYKFRR
jgi:hypothetical protein